MSEAKEYSQVKVADSLTATIANGQTESSAVPLYGCSLVGLIMPAAFDGTVLYPKASNDGANYFDMYNTSGTRLSITVSTSRWIALLPSDFAGVKHLKLISGTSETGAREIKVVARAL